MAATILIADDDAVQRRLVENMVQKCGYEALVAESGAVGEDSELSYTGNHLFPPGLP